MRKFATIVIATLLAERVVFASALISYEQSLQTHHVALTRTAIVEALQSSDSEVRWLAASKLLLNDHALETVPAVEAALEKEKVPQAEINIAFALALVGDQPGVTALTNACADENMATALQLKSAGYLLQMGRMACVDTIRKALRSDIVNHMAALSLIPALHNLSQADSQALTGLVLEDLTNKEAVIRLRASRALGGWGHSALVPDLQNALANEADEPTRAEMQRDLALLSNKPEDSVH